MIQENRFLTTLRRVSDFLNAVLVRLCFLGIASMTLIVLLGVFFRYVIQIPLSWTEELSRYLMIWVACLAITIAIKEKSHVGLSILVDKAKARGIRLFLETVILLITLVFLVIMTYYALQMSKEAKWQISQGLGISMVLPTLAIAVSMLLGIFQLWVRYLLDWGKLGDGAHPQRDIIDV